MNIKDIKLEDFEKIVARAEAKAKADKSCPFCNGTGKIDTEDK